MAPIEMNQPEDVITSRVPPPEVFLRHCQFRSFNAVRHQYWGAVLDAALIPHLNP